VNKRLWVILAAVMLGVILFACTLNPPTGFDSFFKNFNSQQPYVSITEMLCLKSIMPADAGDTYISAYFAEERVFRIAEDIGSPSNPITLFGLSSDTRVYVFPTYRRIIDIKGDFAIVTRTELRPLPNDPLNFVELIGLVRFRGQGAAREVAGFNYQYNAQLQQFSFLGDKHLVTLGTVNTVGTSITHTFATVYDISQPHGVLEVGRIETGFHSINPAKFIMHDNTYISVVEMNLIRFFNINDISRGRFNVIASTHGLDAGRFNAERVVIEPFYIDNGWFLIKNSFISNTQFTGFDWEDHDENGDRVFVFINTVRMNVRSNSVFSLANDGVDKTNYVANEHNRLRVGEITNVLNDASLRYDRDLDMIHYVPPVFNPAEIVRAGYTIVYFKFAYYVNVQGTLHRQYAQSFVIMDENANVINNEGFAMPILFIDGVGLLNGDPNFGVPATEASFFRWNTRVPLNVLQDNFTAFDTTVAHSGMIITNQMNIQNPALNFVGAFNLNGNIAVPFRYHALSPFFGDYAIGYIISGVGSSATVAFYRVHNTGAQTPISDDVFAVHNGVYVTRTKVAGNAPDKFGIKTNDGTLLLPNVYDDVSVIEHFLVNGNFISTVVAVVENGMGKVYRLG
jgi:hypothetical protein